jgi:hypothetical protein
MGAVLAVAGSWQNTAAADTNPPSGTPATVSDDALPTVQIGNPTDPSDDGAAIVWTQVTVGNTVYAGGDFTRARPAGVALGGPGTVSRYYLLAYDLTTGALDTSLDVQFNGPVRSLAVSPDNSRLYVGGKFTTADGVTHSHLAAIDLTTKTLISSFTAGFRNGSSVRALAATNTAVYAGGDFTTTSTGASRKYLAAFNSSGTLLAWAPTVNNASGVQSMVIVPGHSNVVVAGNFTLLNSQKYHSIGAINLSSGAALPWASQSDSFPIRPDSSGSTSAAQIGSLSTDGNNVYLTAWNSVSISSPGGYEGTAAIKSTDGSLLWADDCHGDAYSGFEVGQVMYSVGHAHDCEPGGAFPQAAPPAWHRALAETTYATGVNGYPTHGYTNYQGTPTPTQLDWYPDLETGPYLGQAAWSVTGNSNYISLGGEFARVNRVAQQGLVRFAIGSLAPNKQGPRAFNPGSVVPHTVLADGTAKVSVVPTWDPDNAVLTYNLYRDNGSTPIFTFTRDSRFWRLPVQVFTDTGLIPGSTHSYTVVATDPFGNSVTSSTGFTTGGSVIGDFDGDGLIDMTYFQRTGGAVYWHTNAQDPTVSLKYGITGDIPSPGDYNGDGICDIAVWRPSSGTWYARGIAVVKLGASGDLPVPGDYNGDGKTDYAVWRPSTGRWYVSGLASVKWGGTSGDLPLPGDYNSDGKTDYAIWRPSTKQLFVRGLTTKTFSSGRSGDIPAVGDYNGDGKTDFALWRPSTGVWYVSTDLSTFGTTAKWGSSGDIPAPGNYGGTASPGLDFAVFRPSNRVFYDNQHKWQPQWPSSSAPTAVQPAIGHKFFSSRY